MNPSNLFRALLVATLAILAVIVCVPQSEAASVVVRRGVGFRQRVVVRQPSAVVVGPRNAAAIIAPQSIVVPSSPAIVVPSQQLIVPQQQLLIVR
jgi:hypothetical protein